MSDGLVVARAEPRVRGGVTPLAGLGTRGAGGGGGGVGDDRGVLGGSEDGEFAGEAVDLRCNNSQCLLGGGWRLARVTHTTASCSFSSCRCRSTAVRGRGCRKGPGPGPTPVLSPIEGPEKKVVAGNGRGGRLGEPEAFTALWFEGRMFNEGEPGVGGGGICCEDARRDEAARKRGDGGTELRSGMAAFVPGREGFVACWLVVGGWTGSRRGRRSSRRHRQSQREGLS